MNRMHPAIRSALTVVGLFALAAIGCLATAPRTHAQADRSAFLVPPHADSVLQDSARLVWVSGPGVEAGRVTVTGGPVSSAAVEAKPVDGRTELLHVAVLKGLRSGVRYTYRAECDGAVSHGTFRTAPADSTAFRFVVYGDTRSRPARHQAVSEAIAKEQPDFVIHTGDLVANGDDWALWKKEFFDPAQPYLSECAFWPCRGNHEGSAVLYRDLFDAPNEGLFYSFDWGNAHFVFLDNYEQGADRQAMLDWFKKDLSEDKAEWTFVIYHEPSFNVGGHASTWGREDVVPVMYGHGVDFALAGHSHLYERFLPIAPPGKKPITFIVTGGGGAPTYPAVPSPILVGGIGDSEIHYCLFEVSGNRLTMTAKRPDGSTIDRLELVKTDGAYQPEVMAQTVDYDRAVAAEFAFAHAKVELSKLPAPGQSVDAVLSLPGLPAGAGLTVGPAESNGGWTVPQQSAEPVQGGYRFLLTAPSTPLAGGADGFKPPLRVRLAVRGGGLNSSADSVALAPGADTQKRLQSQPQPVSAQ